MLHLSFMNFCLLPKDILPVSKLVLSTNFLFSSVYPPGLHNKLIRLVRDYNGFWFKNFIIYITLVYLKEFYYCINMLGGYRCIRFLFCILLVVPSMHRVKIRLVLLMFFFFCFSPLLILDQPFDIWSIFLLLIYQLFPY